MVKIEKMTTEHIGEVIELAVADEQVTYVGTIFDILKYANAQVRPYVIIREGQVVGFFLIDTVYSKDYDFAPSSSLGLRCFFIDQHHQRKGYARHTLKALPAYLASIYPNHADIYLTVNCRNLQARDCYLKAGFEDIEALYQDGPAGPQHIMRLAL